MKKQNKDQQRSFTGPLLDTLVNRPEANCKVPTAETCVPPDMQPPDLYQDAGGGYNSDFTYPQE